MPDFAYSPPSSNRMRRYILHTDNPEVVQDSKHYPRGKLWEFKGTHPNGVQEHEHFYGSVLYSTKARSLEEARSKIEPRIWKKPSEK